MWPNLKVKCNRIKLDCNKMYFGCSSNYNCVLVMTLLADLCQKQKNFHKAQIFLRSTSNGVPFTDKELLVQSGSKITLDNACKFGTSLAKFLWSILY